MQYQNTSKDFEVPRRFHTHQTWESLLSDAEDLEQLFEWKQDISDFLCI